MLKVGFEEHTTGSGMTAVEDAECSGHPSMSKTKGMWTE